MAGCSDTSLRWRIGVRCHLRNDGFVLIVGGITVAACIFTCMWIVGLANSLGIPLTVDQFNELPLIAIAGFVLGLGVFGVVETIIILVKRMRRD